MNRRSFLKTVSAAAVGAAAASLQLGAGSVETVSPLVYGRGIEELIESQQLFNKFQIRLEEGIYCGSLAHRSATVFFLNLNYFEAHTMYQPKRGSSDNA